MEVIQSSSKVSCCNDIMLLVQLRSLPTVRMCRCEDGFITLLHERRWTLTPRRYRLLSGTSDMFCNGRDSISDY
jgi:hypothetical protein